MPESGGLLNGPPMISGPVSVQFDASAFGLTVGQLRNLKVVTIDPGLLSPALPITVDDANRIEAEAI